MFLSFHTCAEQHAWQGSFCLRGCRGRHCLSRQRPVAGATDGPVASGHLLGSTILRCMGTNPEVAWNAVRDSSLGYNVSGLSGLNAGCSAGTFSPLKPLTLSPSASLPDSILGHLRGCTTAIVPMHLKMASAQEVSASSRHISATSNRPLPAQAAASLAASQAEM